ncbi:polysaccharide deacetylase family protein [candidate division KSB1 bacterium]|nr:polysaccharide deacetylase family protein [candidate division KSB1 bacterium]
MPAKSKTNSRRAKRCYRCGKLIDAGKERFFLKRPFCGESCMIKESAHDFRLKVPLRWPPLFGSRKDHWISIADLLHVLEFIVIIILAVFVVRLSLTVKSLQQPQPVITTDTTPTTLADSVFYTNPLDAMVLRNHIDLEGEAGDHLIISLTVNDDLTAVTIPEKGKFTFRNIKLEYGKNILVIRALDPAGKTVVLERLETQFGSPRLDYLARDFTRGSRSKPKLALTFDGGAGNHATGPILDHLLEKNISCTMFLTGRFIQRYPDLVERMIQDGHQVANHTWSHPHLTTFYENRKHTTHPGISRQDLQKELNKTASRYYNQTGHKMSPFWRAPFGEHNLEIRRWAAEIGYTQVGWTLGHGESLDTMDWVADTTVSYYRTAEEIMQNILEFENKDPNGLNGGIILMHLDTQRNGDHAYEILPALIDTLRHKGYEFTTISKMFNR